MSWRPASEPPDTTRQVIVALKWHHYDGSIQHLATAAEYYPDAGFWAIGSETINGPDEVLFWQDLPALPEELK